MHTLYLGENRIRGFGENTAYNVPESENKMKKLRTLHLQNNPISNENPEEDEYERFEEDSGRQESDAGLREVDEDAHESVSLGEKNLPVETCERSPEEEKSTTDQKSKEIQLHELQLKNRQRSIHIPGVRIYGVTPYYP